MDKVLDYPILIPPPPNPRPCHQWSFQSLVEDLGDKKLACRVWKKCNKQVLETSCDHVNVSMKEFYAWLQSTADYINPLKEYDRSSHAAYIDYKYMKDVFSDCPNKLQEVQWRDFGLPNFDGTDSTIWIGSEGANTPGHQDSYGFNLVSQIAGRKLWVLFPPSDSNYLYPTRVPYEESSVFTQLHLGLPDGNKYPAVKLSHPQVVVLHPGQTLYVPHHWWHYVESLDPSISINVWVPHKDDTTSHITEAMTRFLFTSLLAGVESRGDNSLFKQLLNPTENLTSRSENIHYIQCAIDRDLMTPSDSTQDGPKPVQDETGCFGVRSGMGRDGSGIQKDRENYLEEFQSWVAKSCRIVSNVSVNPCLGFCRGPNDFHGCIDKSDVWKGKCHSDSTGFHDVRANRKKGVKMSGSEAVNHQDGDGFVSRKRRNEFEMCDVVLKSDRHEKEGADLTADNDIDDTCQENVPSSSGQGRNEGHVNSKQKIYALRKSLSFEQFIHLMRVKNTDYIEEAKRHDKNRMPCSEKDGTLSCQCNLECTKTLNSPWHEPSSPLSHPPSAPSSSSPLSTLSSSSTSNNHQIFSKSPQTNSCDKRTDKDFIKLKPFPCISDHDRDSNNADKIMKTVTEANSLHQESLPTGDQEEGADTIIDSRPGLISETDVQKCLFESILHPSVVEQISGLFKAKYMKLL